MTKSVSTGEKHNPLIILAFPAFVTANPTTVSALDLSQYMGTYLCTATAGAGLVFSEETREWYGGQFRTEKEQYIVRVEDTGSRREKSYAARVKKPDGTEVIEGVKDTYPVVVIRLKKRGEDDFGFCMHGFPDTEDKLNMPGIEQVMSGQSISCFYDGTRYRFDFRKGRFQSDSSGGYMMGYDAIENKSTPYIYVGKCDKID